MLLFSKIKLCWKIQMEMWKEAFWDSKFYSVCILKPLSLLTVMSVFEKELNLILDKRI